MYIWKGTKTEILQQTKSWQLQAQKYLMSTYCMPGTVVFVLQKWIKQA